MFRDSLTGLGGSLLAGRATPAETDSLGTIETKDTAGSVILLFLGGAPSYVDTFDFKNIGGVTPADLSPEPWERRSILCWCFRRERESNLHSCHTAGVLPYFDSIRSY